MLSGREVGHEITAAEVRQAADAKLVVVYGYSDDYVELHGAIEMVSDAYMGTTIYLTPKGYLDEPACCSRAEDCTCPYFAPIRRTAKTIEAVWHDWGDPRWTYKTDIPHETFDIYEDGEV